MDKKKNFGISGLINKQPNEIKKPVLDAETIEKAAKGIHTDEKKKVRLSIDISVEEHKKLKIKAVQNDHNIMSYVHRLILNDLSK